MLRVQSAVIGLCLSMMTFAASAECPKNLAAIELANEADKIRVVDFEAGIAKYEEATRADPTNHRIFWKLAETCIKGEEWEKADQALAQATRLAPTFASYYLAKGRVVVALAAKNKRRLADAQGAFEMAAKLDPHFGEPHYQLGELLSRLGDKKGAADHYTLAIGLQPDAVPFYVALANLYYASGFLDQAAAVAREGLTWELPPSPTWAESDAKTFGLHMSLARTLADQKHPDDGLGELEKARARCGPCNESDQILIFFRLGAAYASSRPPRRQEGIQNLKGFDARICKGSKAGRFKTECEETERLLVGLGAG